MLFFLRIGCFYATTASLGDTDSYRKSISV